MAENGFCLPPLGGYYCILDRNIRLLLLLLTFCAVDKQVLPFGKVDSYNGPVIKPLFF